MMPGTGTYGATTRPWRAIREATQGSKRSSEIRVLAAGAARRAAGRLAAASAAGAVRRKVRLGIFMPLAPGRGSQMGLRGRSHPRSRAVAAMLLFCAIGFFAATKLFTKQLD